MAKTARETFWLALLVGLSWAGCIPPAGAAADPVGADRVSDVRILVDVSGSMKKNDPHNLRIPALRLLIGLLPIGSRAGIWTFGRYVNMLVRLGEVDARWKSRAEANVAGVHSRGLFTNIEAALDRSTRAWKTPDAHHRRSIILLTDGMVDISKDSSRNAASRARIVAKLLPRLKRVGARIFTIALSNRADHELMRTLAVASDGWYEQATDARQLQRQFLRMFEKTHAASAVPIDDNRFEIDKSVREFTLLVFHKPGAEPLRLVGPSGLRFGHRDAPNFVKWRAGEEYDLVTVTKPPSGQWRIRARADPDNRVLIVTDLELAVTGLPNYLQPGAHVMLEASLVERGRVVRDRDFLNLVSIRLEQRPPSGDPSSWRLVDDGSGDDETAADGIFSLALGRTLSEGRHELVITADAKTFAREHRQTVIVTAPVDVDVSRDRDTAGFRMTVTARDELIDPRNVEVSGTVIAPDGRRFPLQLSFANGRWEGLYSPAVEAGDYKIAVTLSGRTAGGDPLRFEAEPVTLSGFPAPKSKPVADPPAPPAGKNETARVDVPAPGPSWIRVGLTAGLVNLAFIIGGFLTWRRQRKRHAVEMRLVHEAV